MWPSSSGSTPTTCRQGRCFVALTPKYHISGIYGISGICMSFFLSLSGIFHPVPHTKDWQRPAGWTLYGSITSQVGDQDSIVQNTGLGATGLKKLLKDGSGFEHDFLPVSNVVFQNLKFPDSPLVSFQAKDLIRRLVMKDPKSRLRSEKGAAVIKRHPFFEGLN
ncbi:hypothetical protein YC2023_049308 [Brassica napus]